MAREDFNLDDYDPDHIHRAGSDQNGHSWRSRVSFPKNWAGWLQTFVEDIQFPNYENTHDFIRDAVYHRLQHWRNHPGVTTSPELARDLTLARMNSELAATQSFSDQVKETRERLEAVARTLHEARDYRNLTALLDSMEDEVRINFNDPYLTDLLDRINYWRKSAQ